MSNKIESRAVFRVPARVLYNSFLDGQDLTRLSLGSKCEMDPKEGGRFSLYNGSVEGQNVKLEKDLRIEQRWRFSSWEQGVYSKVVIEFRPLLGEEDCTEVLLVQSEIPSLDKFGNPGCPQQCLAGWEGNFWERFEKVMGFPKFK
ncbi:activator of hsp90 atpase 1 family protein [Cryptosporidium felis]|nr:activator of hsp90 atpase 1 family protein [Cryptosporidium felis]